MLFNTTIIHFANTNSIKNSSITRRDMLIAKEMLDKVSMLHKKTRRYQPNTINIYSKTVEVLQNIKDYYSKVDISVDIMHLNNIPFLASISEYIHQGIAGVLDNITVKKLKAKLKIQ